MPRPRSLLIALVATLVALWALIPMAHAMLILRDDQHLVGSPPSIGGVPATEAHFVTSGDYIPIAGWMVLAHPQAPTVILVPGWKDDRSAMLPYADFLVRGGLNALLIDLRGSGHSGGSFSLGLHEPDDVEAAIQDYLDTLPGLSNHHYGLLGVSFGAEVALATAGDASFPEQDRIRAVVADSPAATEQRDVDRLNFLYVFGLSIPLLPDAGVVVDNTIGGSPGSRTALSGVANLQPGQALLIIHSIHDDNPTTPGSDAQALYAAARVPRVLWLAPQGGHTQALAAQPQDYEARVLGFFKRYLVDVKDPQQSPSSSPTISPAPHYVP